MFYSAGVDISMFASWDNESQETLNEAIFHGNHGMTEYLIKLKNSKKPIVNLVRGKSVGISFTMQSWFDFVYCTPEALFFTPFMKSY